jgi:hypothetical protein
VCVRTECARIHTVANSLAHGRASFHVGTALAEVTTRRENAETEGPNREAQRRARGPTLADVQARRATWTATT